jgi:pimeloyl-ACP methyl ester carboxylesterase
LEEDGQVPYAELNGARLYHQDLGAGEPLLLVHGWPASSFYWENVLPLFARHHRVIAVDLKGFGRSDGPDLPVYTMSHHAADLASLIESKGLRKVKVLGHSMGGMISAMLALERPDLVGRLVLVAAPVHGPTGLFAHWMAAGRMPGRALVFAGRRLGGLIRLLGTAFTAGAPIPRQLVSDIGLVKPRAAFDSFDSMVRTDLLGRLEKITLPTLVVYGDVDRIVTPMQPLHAQSRIRGAVLKLIPGCGHCPGIEAVDRFVQIVEPFLVTEAKPLATAG